MWVHPHDVDMKIVYPLEEMMDTYTQTVPPKRRYLELEQKRRIVEETLAEGGSVAQIARLHGVNAKRLERGRFVWPQASEGVVYLTRAQLSMLLEGIDWRRPERTWDPQLAV
jgi:hypothetical protein